MGYFTKEQFAAFGEQLKRKKAKKPRRRPRTNAERKAAYVAAGNDIGEIPRVRHRRVRAACRLDLVKFGVCYFGGTQMLRHKPSEQITASYIVKLQEVILHGGQFVVEFPRGAGKTTWMMIALAWALLYGHKRFAVAVAASGTMAKRILKSIVRLVWTNPALAADFPAVAVPFKKIGGVPQKAASQTYHGEKTFIELGADSVRFPMLRGADGAPLDTGCGAALVAVGKGGAVKGQNDMGARPDIVLLDDPQTRKDAASASATQAIDEYIHGDILGLGGHDAATISCLVAITPICYGDIATRLVSPVLHPEWITVVQPLVTAWPDNHERIIGEFLEAYKMDAARKDAARTLSRAYYAENRAAFDEMQVIDTEAFDHESEYDARHHVLNLIARHGMRAFRAEYQLTVGDEGGVKRLAAETVAGAVNGCTRGVIPSGMVGAVAFVDVNIKEGAGLSWVCVAFGKRRTAAVIDYGRYPRHGALLPEGATATARDQIVAAAVRKVIDDLAARRYRRPGMSAVNLNAVCFDRGWSAAVVTRTLAVTRKTVPLPFALLCSVGRGWKMFARQEKRVKRWGDHVVARESGLGDYIEIHADYWREMSQTGFFAPPLTPGSVSVFGADPSEHTASDFADEVAAEKLVMRYTDPVTGREAWQFERSERNHYGDSLAGAFAVGSWFGYFDATDATVDLSLPAQRPAAVPANGARRQNARGFFKRGFWK